MEYVNEINVIRKPYKKGRLGVAIAYPSLYEAAVRSLSIQMLYFYLNSFDEIMAERFVLKKIKGEEPAPVSLESRQPLKNFRLIIFSVHYEPDYVNIVRLLQSGGVPPLAEKRKQVVVVGGPPVIANPEPLCEIADVLVVGEIESTLPELMEKVFLYYDNKRAFLDSLEPEAGFYVPSRKDEEEIIFNYSDNLYLDFHPAAQFQPANGEWRRTTMIEVSRGCVRGCRFCMEGWIFTPKRDRPVEDITWLAEKGFEGNGSRHLTLISLSLLDHREIDKLLETFVAEKYEFSFPSLRLDALNSERLYLLAKSGQRTLVLAPETTCYRTSLAIGKPFFKERLIEVGREAVKLGFKSLKLYFMIGLPGEKKEDIESIARLVKELSEATGYRGRHRLKLSVNVFVPKPQTPMQWFSMEKPDSIKSKMRKLRREVGDAAEVRLFKPAWAYVQCVLARGGRELTKLILEWAENGGGLGGWRKAVEYTQTPVDKYVNELKLDEEHPWSKVKLPMRLRVFEDYKIFKDILSSLDNVER
ncbi:MAG: radical SAM protein [Thermofilaceae archaeon]|nr:radical SAM protein [Thermofilaceae archaeon]MCX8181108.1 radical SAM protein [Thermofilaceae archaeon]MDW8004886.1 radical SAM protein [Thermofilaceae archaeon]